MAFGNATAKSFSSTGESWEVLSLDLVPRNNSQMRKSRALLAFTMSFGIKEHRNLFRGFVVLPSSLKFRRTDAL